MIFYEYDTDGFLTGWYESEIKRPNSTEIKPIEPCNMAKWDGNKWILDDYRSKKINSKLLISKLWDEVNKFAEEQFDFNSRISLLWFYSDPKCPEWRKERILAIQSWWSYLWSYYGTLRNQIELGISVNFDKKVVGNCPYSIWEISSNNL